MLRASTEMRIRINGEEKEFDGEALTMAEVLEELGMDKAPVVVELNRTALLKHEIPDQRVQEGDRIEIVRIVAGG